MEECDLSFENWQFWCRLCGSLGSQQHIDVFDVTEEQQPVFFENEQEISLVEAIRIHLNMTIAQKDKLPKMICPHCTEFIKSFTIYHKRVHNVQKMFKTIYENDLVEWHELDEVRKKFGIPKKESAELSILNSDHGNDIVTESIGHQLSCVPIKKLIENKSKENDKHQEILSELECGIETDIYTEQSLNGNNYITFTSDHENLEETITTNNIEMSHVHDMGGHITENSHTIQMKSNIKRNVLLEKASKSTKINVTCNRCHEKFEYFKQYREHLIEKHNKQKDSKKWECPKCEKSFTSDYLLHHLKKHILAQKANKKMDITCNYCEEEFQYYETYRVHLIEKHNKQNDPKHWECPKCEKSFLSSNGLERHLINHTSPNELNEFSCTNCNKQFLTKKSLKEHIKHTHSLERYVCEECGVTVKNITSIVKQHKLTHSKEEPFECTVCSRRFKYAPLLKTHMETHDNRKHICNICGLKLNTRSTLRGHMKVHDDVKKFKCDLCDKAFKLKASLKTHLGSHAGQKLYTCDICGLGFTYRCNIRRHKLNIHPEKCASWKKTESNENLVFLHACIICDLKFNTRSTLRHHMKVHNDIRKFKCHLCDKAFKLKTSLQTHFVSHAGLKLYSCDICGLNFAHHSNIRRHKINIHSEKWDALDNAKNNKKVNHSLPTIETLKELAALNFNNGDGKKHKQNKK